MITTRREVMNRRNSFIDYDETEFLFAEDQDKIMENKINDEYSYSNSNINNTKEDLAEKEYSSNELENEFQTESLDLMPSSTTMQFYGRKTEEHFESVVRNVPKSKVKNKAKLMVQVYIIAVIALFALIIINSAAIAMLGTKVSAATAEVEYLRELNFALGSDLDSITNEEYIRREAERLGMGSNNGENTVVLPPATVREIPENSTNWFDEFCQFISRIFN